MDIDQLHARYCALTSPLVLDYNKRVFWKSWLDYRKHKPFTIQDLETVIRYLKAEIKKGERKPACLLFRNLICNPDYFEEDLGLAQQAMRQKPATPRQRILQAAGRPERDPAMTARSAAQIMAASEALREFRALKERL